MSPGSDPDLSRDASSPESGVPDSRASSKPPSGPDQDSEAATARPSSLPSPHMSGWRYTLRSFGNRDYLRLWIGNSLMMAGFQMQTVAQGYLVYDLTRSGTLLGLVSSGYGLPVLSLALVGGAVADRVERKRLIQAGQGTYVVLALFIAVSITTESITWVHLLAVSMLQGVVWAFSAPARLALLPQLVGPNDLGNAIGLLSAGMSASFLVAPAAAGLLYAVAGPEGVYYTITALGIAAVASTTTIRRVPPPVGGTATPVLADIREGIAHIWGIGMVRILLGITLVFILLSSPFQALIPVMVVDVYHLDAVAQGILVSMLGLGSLVGAIGVASMGDRGKRGLVLIAAGLASGVVLVLVAAIPVFLVAVVLLVVLGLGNTSQWSLAQVTIMGLVDDRFRGRLMSILIMSFGLMPLAVLPAGLAIDVVGPRVVVGTMGAGLVVAFTLILLTQKGLRRLE